MPGLTLALDSTPTFTFSACWAQGTNSSLCGRDSVTFTVTRSRLVAVIDGGNVTVGAQPVVLDASRSYDPDDPTSPLSYTWLCETRDTRQDCRQPDGSPAFPASAAGNPVQRVTLAGVQTTGQVNDIRLLIAKGDRTATTSVYVNATQGRLPLISLQGLGTGKANPSARINLLATVSTGATAAAGNGSTAASPVNTTWSQVVLGSEPRLNLSDPNVAATPLDSPSLVLRPGVLEPNTTYTFELNATDAAGTGRARVTVPTSAAPRGINGARTGNFTVTALEAGAPLGLKTPFAASVSGVRARRMSLIPTFDARQTTQGQPALSTCAPICVYHFLLTTCFVN